MNIEIFSVCDYASDYGQGKLNVLGTFDTVFAPSYPFVLPQSAVAARIRVGRHEEGHHEFEIRFLDSDGNVFREGIKGQADIKLGANEDYSTFNMPINLGAIEFPKAGRYAVELHWDGEFAIGLTVKAVLAAQVQGMQKAA